MQCAPQCDDGWQICTNRQSCGCCCCRLVCDASGRSNCDCLLVASEGDRFAWLRAEVCAIVCRKRRKLGELWAILENMENLSERSDEENVETTEEIAQNTERAESGLDGLVADVNIPRGTVVLAATPIGNTGDASARLIALMEGADIVAAEDTRRLYALANRLGIRVPGRVIAYHDHNERDKADGLLDQVEQGATVLVVSDAGMPTINDPGLAIVRRAIERGLPVTCAPGPSRRTRRAVPVRPADRPLLLRRLPAAQAQRTCAASARAQIGTSHHRLLRNPASHRRVHGGPA